MTIAAGFFCKEGIVLAADTKYTTGGLVVYGDKLFNLPEKKGFTVSIAGAGDVDFIKAVTNEIDDCLPDSATLDELTEIVEDQNSSFQRDYVFPNPSPPNEKPDYSLLVGISVASEGTRLLKTSRDTTTKVDGCEIIGTGYPVAQAFLKGMFTRDMPIEEVEYLAMYAVHKAKLFDEGCGGKIDCVSMVCNGPRRNISQRIIKKTEEYFEHFNEAFTSLIIPPPHQYQDESVVLGEMLNNYVRDLLKLRQELREMRDWDYYRR